MMVPVFIVGHASGDVGKYMLDGVDPPLSGGRLVPVPLDVPMVPGLPASRSSAPELPAPELLALPDVVTEPDVPAEPDVPIEPELLTEPEPEPDTLSDPEAPPDPVVAMLLEPLTEFDPLGPVFVPVPVKGPCCEEFPEHPTSGAIATATTPKSRRMIFLLEAVAGAPPPAH